MFSRSNKKQTLGLFALLFLIIYWFSLPEKLFDKPLSTVILDQNDQLLGAHVAADGQWRFPEIDSVPNKFKQCIIRFEDRYFYRHPGVNLQSLARAAWQDIRAGKIVSGGSTIDMQCIRLAYDNPQRTFWQKFKEIILATRLNIRYSKEEILRMYASNAPFGSNVVGLEAASWRFFGRGSKDLSWAESATLAVLPNAPSLIFPGKNEEKLRAKRNRLLNKLLRDQIIDSLTYSLSVAEPLPGKVKALPALAPHLLNRLTKESSGAVFKTHIDKDLQRVAYRQLRQYARRLQANYIFNAAVIVVEIKSGNVIVYLGNTPHTPDGKKHGNYVDVIQARRSSGSILKPFLYAAQLDEGLLLPQMLVPDIPTSISGYKPQNFNHHYSGVVPADKALQQSLNVPAVRELQTYGVQHFKDKLQDLGFTTIDRSADNYGLSLILGGAEVKLWDLAGAYSSMARVLANYYERGYYLSDWHEPLIEGTHQAPQTKGKKLSASAIWFTLEAMKGLQRPQDESGWDLFSSTRQIAWKTGTSHGFRDAWALGLNPRYLVGVWVGNADGEGRAGMTGIATAAPLMFQIFNLLPASAAWFEKPVEEMAQLKICSKSGYRAGPDCPESTVQLMPRKAAQSRLCPYHKLIHLDATGRYRVTSRCEAVSRMQHRKWFVLPPVQAWYYKQRHPDYFPPPPYKSGCAPMSGKVMEMVYPRPGAKIFIPHETGGQRGAVVFEVSHKDAHTKVFWNLDRTYIGFTQGSNRMALSPPKGRHLLSLTDENGASISFYFEVVE
jgi:penicillin-binding protein 1C